MNKDRFKFRTPYYYRYSDPEQNIKTNGFAYFSYFNLTDCPTERTTNGIPCYRNKGEYEQCTGLKDKNGNLIYEGDIIKDELGRKYQAQWNNTQWLFTGDMVDFYPHILNILYTPTESCEIIGNIHEQKDSK